MTVPGPQVPQYHQRRSAVGVVGTYLWAFMPLLTCGFAAPIGFATALAKQRDNLTLTALIVHSVLMVSGCTAIGVHESPPPDWANALFYATVGITSVGATAHLLIIRSAVWALPPLPQRPVERSAGMEAVDQARMLREQARRTASADPMLAKRLGIGRPDLPRQYDDGGLVDLNHAPLHVLLTLPGVGESSARQIQDRVERVGPFANLGEVMLVVEISPAYEYHLHEYCVFIP